MFYKKEDLIRIGLDVGVIVGSGVLFRHCIVENNNWIERSQFREVKTENGESVYERIPGSGKLVDKNTLEQISKFKRISNLVGTLAALYGVICGSTMLASDLSIAISNRRIDKKWDSYWEKYEKLIQNDSLNSAQKQEALSCLRTEYGYTNIFEDYKKANEAVVKVAVEEIVMEKMTHTADLQKLLDNLEKGRKEYAEDLTKNNSKETKVEAQVVSTIAELTQGTTEEEKKEAPKQNIDTALENKKPAVYDEA